MIPVSSGVCVGSNIVFLYMYINYPSGHIQFKIDDTVVYLLKQGHEDSATL